jgi:hypothetical protein
MRNLLERFRDVFNWGWLAYRVVWVLVATGVASAIGGAVWAMLIGVPLPIAIMAGYCTLVGAVYLAIAPMAYRAVAMSMIDLASWLGSRGRLGVMAGPSVVQSER